MSRRVSLRGKGADLFFGETAALNPLENRPVMTREPDDENGRRLATETPTQHKNDGRNDRPTESPDDRSIDHPADRIKVRHSFDVYQDQLLQLSQLQMALYEATGKKPALGDLAQKALDTFLHPSDRSIDHPVMGERKGG